MALTVAVDGSALGNPGPAGWCWYLDESTWAAGGWEKATNNQGELQAVIELLEATEHTDEDLEILADSQYVINSITKWMPGWKRKGWKKADGKPVQNQSQMIRLDELMTAARSAGRTIRFEWVKGHAGHELNEEADDRARSVATAYQNGDALTNELTGPGFDASSTGHTPADVTVATELSQDESDFILARAADNGVHPRTELADLIRLGLAHKYPESTPQ